MNPVTRSILFFGGMAGLISVVLTGAVLSAKESRGVRSKSQKYAEEIVEPSGIAYHPKKECLVVVGDEGQIAEVSLTGKVLFQKNLGDDLEGVTADPDHSILFVIDEKLEIILVVDWETYEIRDTLPLREIVEKAGFPRGQKYSFEGIAYEPAEGAETGTLWLGHQRHPTVLVPLELEGSPIRVKASPMIKVDLPEISGLCFDPKDGDLWIVCDKEDACFRVSREGEILAKKRIGGRNQEGMAILPNGTWWFADDAGGIFKKEVDRD